MTLDGPFTVYDLKTAVTVKDPITKLDVTTYTKAVGVHHMTDLASYLAQEATLKPYRVIPSEPLQRVWAGDDPTNPQWTVSLVFPDQATATSVLAKVLPPQLA